MSEDTAQDKKRKPTGDNVTTLRTDNMTSGDILRLTREKRKLTLDDVSAAIHVRAAQLRAIEEGNVDALPGMTYAAGFVKSYASYLKLNPVELSNKFKAEHGALKPLMPDLPEAKPIVENRMPDPRLVGFAALAAVVLVVAWAWFAGDDVPIDGVVPPVVQTTDSDVGGATQQSDVEGAEQTAGSPEETEGAAPAQSTQEQKADAPDAQAPAVQAKAEEGKAVEHKEDVKPAEDKASDKQVTAQAPVDAVPVEEKTEAVASPETAPTANAEPVATIVENIMPPLSSGIVLTARRATWIQVSDAGDRVVFKKLLRAGEQYSVPAGSGYTLNTTNAGGLDVMVNGKKAPALGKAGEVLHAVPLTESDLTRVKRAQSRINN